jgi:polyisoprenoid-binding protein YceI
MSSQKTAGRSRLPIIIGIAVVAVLALGIGGVIYMFSGSAPAAVSLGSAAPGSSSAAGGGSLEGTWKVDTSIGSFSDFSSSFVGYRVNENLANVGSTVAAGRTPKVSGSLTFAGTTISEVKITADLSSLQSDKPMRDGQLHRQALETDQFPSATFELTTPIQLPSAPADGQTLSVTAQGKLTLHGVTKDVSIPLEAKLSGGTVTVVGSIKITFADFSISPPQSMMVLSVDNFGQMEIQLHFTKG